MIIVKPMFNSKTRFTQKSILNLKLNEPVSKVQSNKENFLISLKPHYFEYQKRIIK